MASIKSTGLWFGVMLVATGLVGTGLFVAREIRTASSLDAASTQTSAVPSPAEAEALLTDAHRLAQTPNRLCQTIAQNEDACRQVLRWAEEAHAMPSTEMPTVLEVSLAQSVANTQEARVLHIRGTHADGSSYTGEFSAVRTTNGEIRSQNAIYWYSDFVPPSNSS